MCVSPVSLPVQTFADDGSSSRTDGISEREDVLTKFVPLYL